MQVLLFILAAVMVLGIIWLLCGLFNFPQQVSLIILLIAALVIIVVLATGMGGALHLG